MSIIEQEQIKEEYHAQAMRYMTNAKDSLQKAQKNGKYYQDQKYVRMAGGTAYSGLLVGLDGLLLLKGITPKGKERKSVEYYQRNITKIDKKMLGTFITAYHLLHLIGYYDGITKVDVIKSGFDDAYTLINKIKPKSVNSEQLTINNV